MIQNLKIRCFRSHSSVDLNHLGKINLLLGKNNAGKTAALEALFFLLSPANPKEALLRLNEVRGYGPTLYENEIWSSLFYNWDFQKSILIEAEDNLCDLKQQTMFPEVKRNLEISAIIGEISNPTSGSIIQSSDFIDGPQGLLFRFSSDNSIGIERKVTDLGRSSKKMVNVRYPNDRNVAYLPAHRIQDIREMALLFSQLEITNQHEIIIEAVKIIEPRLKKIIVVATSNGSALYGDIGTAKLMPLPLMGEGILHTLSIALAIAKTENGVVLIDEIENGLHHSVLEKVWQIIGKISENLRVQIFAATHSDECIQSAYTALKHLKLIDSLRLFRFDQFRGITKVTDYSAKELEIALASEQEVR